MKRWYLILFLYAMISDIEAAEPYEVCFSGIEDPEILASLQQHSQLVRLKEHPPLTPTALKRRAEKDVPNLVRVLHSYALFNAYVEVDVDQKNIPATVLVKIEPGEVYPIAAVEISPNPFQITSADLNLTLEEPAYPKEIIDAEDRLLFLFAKKGYPTASIEKREVVVDQTSRSVLILFIVTPGPLITFGDIELIGLKEVQPCVIYKKLNWTKGGIYHPALIDTTLEKLNSTGLFKTVTISQDNLTADNSLPIAIEVVENKYRSIGGGLSYSTQRGGGFSAEWEHRNIRGLGEKFTINAEMLRESQEINMIYSIPDFLCANQDFILRNEYVYEQTKGYEEKAVSLSAMIERQWNTTLRTSSGLMITQLRNLEKETGVKHNFNLVKLPFFLRLSKVDSRLDPKRGSIFYLTLSPALEVLEKPFFYTLGTATISSYFPSPNERFIFATKASFGTIIGSSHSAIPPSERFYLGSESTLRGYDYFTVSPLGAPPKRKPIGGRSYLLFTIEERWRVDKRFGLVGFFDMGKVSEQWDLSDEIFRKSVGCGMRYFTDVGPLRLDFAVPLNRRKKIDHHLEVYFSVGQAF